MHLINIIQHFAVLDGCTLHCYIRGFGERENYSMYSVI